MFIYIYEESDNMQLKNSINPAYGYIYKITNNTNSKCYIGKTSDPSSRIIKYNSLHCKTQPKLYNALKKYGVSNFMFDIISEVSTEDQLNSQEKEYIQLYDSIATGYNCREGGEGGKQSSDTKHKISLSKLGELNPMFGKPLSIEHRNKISHSSKKSISVKQFSMNGEFVKLWPSAAEAAKSFGKSHNARGHRIILMAYGKSDSKGIIPKSVFGYIWSF